MGRGVNLPRGSIVIVDLDPTAGHEQGGRRPCVVVSATAAGRVQRYPLLAVVPLTSTKGLGDLYPVVEPGPRNGLRVPSTALIDNVRAIDRLRISAGLGAVENTVMRQIDAGLRFFLTLP